jgi:hypothetical protein
MKVVMPKKRWLFLTGLIAFWIYSAINNYQYALPENVCNRAFQAIDANSPDISDLKSAFYDCTKEAIAINFDNSIKNNIIIYIRMDEFDMSSYSLDLCVPDENCQILYLIKSNRFLMKFEKLIKKNLRIVVSDFKTRNAINLSWKNSLIEMRKIKVGRFTSIKNVLKRYPKVYAAEIFSGEGRVRATGAGCYSPVVKGGCNRTYFNAPDEFPRFMEIWESMQKNFPYHQMSFYADYTNDFRTITIIAKDDFVYSPDDADFLKMNQQVAKELCKRLGGFTLQYLPPPGWEKHFGLRIFKYPEDCINDPDVIELSPIFPDDNNYSGR